MIIQLENKAKTTTTKKHINKIQSSSFTVAKPLQGTDKLRDLSQMFIKAQESLVNKEVLNYCSHKIKCYSP